MTSVAPSDLTARSRAHDLARAHGWNAISFQTLRDGFRYLFHGEGYVAYVDTGAAWVAAGPPVCSTGALAETVHAFVAAARAAGKRCCLFGVERRLLGVMAGALDELQIGEQPVWDPQAWSDTLRRSARLREQLRRARAKGVVVRVGTPDDLEASSDQVQRLIGRWLATRAMPPMGFLVAVPRRLQAMAGARFVALRDGHIVGMACLVPVPGRGGWFIEHLLRDPKAPNGTVELLVDAVMRWAAESGSSWLTLGLAPLAGDVPGPLGLARRHLRPLYDFEGLRRFKAKLRPADWMPIYLAFPRSQGAIASTYDALTAFATDGMVRFGLRFVTRGHPAVLAVLAALLVPWTVVLAVLPPSPWFAGHAAVKWSWVAFDVTMGAGLLQILRRPSVRLSWLLAVAVTFDALVTPLEIAFWNLPQIETWFDGLALIVAALAPLVAARALWGATARLEQAAE